MYVQAYIYIYIDRHIDRIDACAGPEGPLAEDDSSCRDGRLAWGPLPRRARRGEGPNVAVFWRR